MWHSFEVLLGRRYLMRAHRHPKVWYIGLAVLLFGTLLVLLSSSVQHTNTGLSTWMVDQLSLGGGDPYLAQAQLLQVMQVLQGIGLGFVVIGVSVSLFGFLLWWMTTFSAFSTFMIATGVAEVLLVLGVMNGFQGYLRSKLIDAHAHVSILPSEGDEWLDQYRLISDEVRSIEGTQGVSPVLNTEVMLRVPSQDITAAVKLMGVDPYSINQTVKLDEFLEEGCGCLSALADVKGFTQSIDGNPSATLTYCANPCPDLSKLKPDRDLPSATSNMTQKATDQVMAIPLPNKRHNTPLIYTGVHLRYNLGLSVGDTFEVISPLGDIGPHGPMPKVRPFKLAGWATSGLAEIDGQQAYTSLSAAQKFLGVGDVVNEIRVRAASIEEARTLRDRLRTHLGKRAVVIDWQERNKNLFNALQLERIAMFLVLTINILLAAFSITSTLVMSLIERRREISILRALGAESRSMRWIFISQGLTAGAVGSALGVLIGGTACALLASFGLPLNAEEIYYISSIPVEIQAYDLLAILFVALGVSALSTVYPAIYAAKIQPLEGIKGQ